MMEEMMDHRDVAAMTRPWWKDGSISERTMSLTAVVMDSEGDEIEISGVRFVYAVCPTCRGKGRHVNPDIDRHGIGREEFDADPQFFEDYRNGVHDVDCSMCRGRRVVPVPDKGRCDPEELRMIEDHIQWLAQEAREMVHEAEMGY
jgi:hypothetical protein